MPISHLFFEQPILNSPYECPARHWELDAERQPTQKIMDARRTADFITPIPKPKKRKSARQGSLLEDVTAKSISSDEQAYHKAIINEIRHHVAAWRALQNPAEWRVTPETARLLQHWRHHAFGGIRPFFCQMEAVETAIWLTEVAPQFARFKKYLAHLDDANTDANPGLLRLALKLATGAGKTTVMAMLIAWQTLNAVRNPLKKSLPRAFWWLRRALPLKTVCGCSSQTIQTPTMPPANWCRWI